MRAGVRTTGWMRPRRGGPRSASQPAVPPGPRYDVRGGGLMETILQDVKYALRQLGRQPSFAILAGLTLALGIGVSTALFSVIDAALLRPLPYPHPEELVTLTVEETDPKGKPSRYDPSMDDIRTWRGRDTILSHAGMGRVSGFVRSSSTTGTPQRLIVAEASEDFVGPTASRPFLVGHSCRRHPRRRAGRRRPCSATTYWQRDASALSRRRCSAGPSASRTSRDHLGVLPARASTRKRGSGRQAVHERQAGQPRFRHPVIAARLRPRRTLAQAREALEAVTAAGRIEARSRPGVVDGVDVTRRDQSVRRHDSDAVAGGRLILAIACRQRRGP